jgi:hypothetical protein
MILNRTVLALSLVTTLSGCAVYTGVSTATLVTTQKSLTDHILTKAVPYSDCNALNLLDSKYYCEIRDISKTYNRNGI